MAKDNKKKGRDPQEAIQTKMKLVATKIEKILLDNEFALFPFTEIRHDGAQIPRVRLVSTKEEPVTNAKPTQNANQGTDKAEVGAGTESDGPVEPEQA
jgi:hypothetical protein